MSRAPRRWSASIPAAALLLLPALVPACSDRPPEQARVEPLRGPDRPGVTIVEPNPTTSDPTVAADVPVPPDSADDAAADLPAPGSAAPDATLTVVQSVLDAYDTVLTSIAGDPLGATTPGHPTLDAWHSVVRPTGSFSAAMLTELRDRATFESTVVTPGPDGFSYRHRVLRAEGLPVSTGAGATLSFTWCGHSPGIGVDTNSGAVVDDAVAVSSGTGELVDEGAGWRLATLDTADLVVESPGTPDPCPDQVAAATRAG